MVLLSQQHHFSPGGMGNCEGNLDQGSLPGSVGAEQTKDRAALHSQVDIDQRMDSLSGPPTAIGFRQVSNFERGGHGSKVRTPRRHCQTSIECAMPGVHFGWDQSSCADFADRVFFPASRRFCVCQFPDTRENAIVKQMTNLDSNNRDISPYSNLTARAFRLEPLEQHGIRPHGGDSFGPVGPSWQVICLV